MLDPRFDLKGTWQAILNPLSKVVISLCWHARSLRKYIRSLCLFERYMTSYVRSLHRELSYHYVDMPDPYVYLKGTCHKICQIPLSTCKIFVYILFRGQSWEHVYVHLYFSNKSKRDIACNVDILNISDRTTKLMSRRHLTIVIQLLMLKGKCWFIWCFSWLYIKSYWGAIKHRN